MRTRNIIEGLTILAPYYKNPDGYHCGAEHDVLYAYATDRPVERAHIERLVELGWFQEDTERDDYEDFKAEHYSPEASWQAFT